MGFEYWNEEKKRTYNLFKMIPASKLFQTLFCNQGQRLEPRFPELSICEISLQNRVVRGHFDLDKWDHQKLPIDSMKSQFEAYMITFWNSQFPHHKIDHKEFVW